MEVPTPVRARAAARLLIFGGCLLALAGCGREGGEGTDRGGPDAADEVVLTPEAAARARAAEGKGEEPAGRWGSDWCRVFHSS